MKRRIAIILAILIIACVYAYTQMTKIHSFTRQECFKCHLDPYDNPSELRAKTVTQLCKSCHKRVVMTSTHPVDVVPRNVQVPPGFPLRDGKITCSTCHDIHKGKETLFEQKTYQLRFFSSDMRFFCVSCHEEDLHKPMHSNTTSVAHVGNYYRANDDSAMTIDLLSAQCIGCHDGTMASAASHQLGAGEWVHENGSHPIGIDYREAARRNRRLSPLNEVDARIRLFDGKVGCGTCHDIFSMQQSVLAMGNNKSFLCRECHYLY